VMNNAGSALMGIGSASGEGRATNAARMAINSPLLDLAIEGARGVLFNITGGSDLSMAEMNEAANAITESIDEDAKVIFGTVVDENLNEGELKVTVIATGFDQPEPIQPQKRVRAFDTDEESTEEPASSTPQTEQSSEEYSQPDEDRGDETQASDPQFVQESHSSEDTSYTQEHEVEQTQKSDTSQSQDAPEEDYDVPAFIRNKLK